VEVISPGALGRAGRDRFHDGRSLDQARTRDFLFAVRDGTSECRHNLRSIAMAVRNYADLYRSFPPAYIADENGKPKHSWRVLLLPFLDEQALYDTYRFDEPWDGPNNRALLNRTPSVLRCPSARRRSTSSAAGATEYFAMVGPTAAWSGPVGRKLSDFPCVTSTTILIIEARRVASPNATLFVTILSFSLRVTRVISITY
jgi:hypothetical protein